MARITVEDCLRNVPNRFDLTLLAAKRARDLAVGTKDPHVAWGNDKPTVVALREIAAGYIDFNEPEVDAEAALLERAEAAFSVVQDPADDADVVVASHSAEESKQGAGEA